MTEEEEREIRPNILKERIDGLEWLIGVLIGTLTEDQKGYIEERMASFSQHTQESAWRRDSDPARDAAAVVYELQERMIAQIEDSAGGFAIYLEQ